MAGRARLVGALAALGAVLCLVLGAALGPASAASDGRVVIRRVDTTAWPAVAVDVLSVGASAANPSYGVSASGSAVKGLATGALVAKAPVDVMFVVDTSRAMQENGALEQVRTVLAELAQRSPAGTRFGLVTFGVDARVVSKLSGDASSLVQNLGVVRAGDRPEAVLRDGLRLGLDELNDDASAQPNVVLVTSSADQASRTSFEELRGDLLERGVVLFAVDVASKYLDASYAKAFADATGGSALDVDRVSAVPAAVRSVTSAISAQQRLTFSADAKLAALRLTVTSGSARADAAVVPGTVTIGRAANPVNHRLTVPAGPSFLATAQGKLIGAVLAMIAVALFALGAMLIFMRDRGSLDSRLSAYAEEEAEQDEDEPSTGKLVRTRFVKRAMEKTSEIAERKGLVTWLEGALAQADIPLRAAEALFFYLAFTVVMAALGLVMTRNLFAAMMMFASLGALPPVLLRGLAARRQKKFLGQLPDTLQLLSGSLKAGYSLPQGMEAVSHEVHDPMARELKRAMVEHRLGRPLEEALEDSAGRMRSTDFEWAVMAIRIQREVGGNLAELLMTVSDTMVQRERLRRDVAALTAEGKISAIVLGILPFALGVVMYAINPSYIRTLFTERLGNFMLGGSIVLAVFGFWWMKKTIEVDV